ncbi:MAG: hypothetical protein JNM56_38630 [Planctomycetia bacterium]|nr:hypothetical protein [Planctomycetia bacterium]
MPKTCEICKQPYADNLTSCPNCDVDIFGAPSDAADAGGSSKPSARHPSQPTTKAENMLPPVGSVAGASPSSGKGQPKPVPPPPPGSPLMARAVEGTKPAAAPAGKPGAPATMVSPQTGQPTMVAPQTGQPTMVAPQSAKATQVAPQGAKPTMVAPQGAKPTMVAPESSMLSDAGAQGSAPAQPSAPAAPANPKATQVAPMGGKPTMVAPQGAKPTMMAPAEEGALDLPAGQPGAKKTMLPQGVGKPTMLTPPGTDPLDVESGAAPAAPVDPKKTQLPKGAAMPTMLAKGGQPTTLQPEGAAPLDLPEGMAPPHDPKKTQLPKGASMPTMLAKGGNPTKLLPDAPAMDYPEGMAPPAELKKTQLAAQPVRTKLLPDAPPMEYPTGMAPAGEKKKTMLPGAPQQTVLSQEGSEPLPYPTGMLPPDDKKKTMLPKGAALHTILAPPEESVPMEVPQQGRKTQLPRSGATPTTLAPPEESTPLAVPGQPDIAESVEMETLSSTTSASMSGELAREALEGGTLTGASEMGIATLPREKPHYKRRWLGGMILGMMLAAGLLSGLWFFKEEPPVSDWLAAIGLKSTRIPSDQPLQDAIAALNAGDLDRVFLILGENSSDIDTPTHHAVRGEARWFRYLKKHNGEKAKMNKDDGEVTVIVEELTKAKTADAPFKERAALWQGHVEEVLGTVAAADAQYRKGAEEHKSHEPVFMAGRNRVAVKPAEKAAPKAPAPKDDAKKDGAGGQARAPMTEIEALEVLAVILTAQQGGAAGAASNEAGSSFWEAYRAAQGHRYDAALKALQEARSTHEKNRFQRLKKAQNPLSDPTEEIFLRAADDLAMHWRMREMLQKNNYDLTKSSPLEALELAIKDRVKPDEALMQIAKALGIDNPTTAGILKAIEGLADDKKIGALVRKAVEDAKYVDEENKDLVKAAERLVNDHKVNLKIVERVDKAGYKDEPDKDKAVGLIIEKRDDLQDTFDKAAQKLVDAKYIEPKPNKDQFLAGIDIAIEAAQSPLVAALSRTLSGAAKAGSAAPTAGIPTFDLAKEVVSLRAQNEILAERLRTVRTPREMLEFWMPLLANTESKDVKAVAEQAGRDARRVLDDKGADANWRAAGNTVQGMAQRLEGKYDDARLSLSDSLKTKKGAAEGQWRRYATNSMRDLTDPTIYYLPRGEELANIGKFDQAIDVLTAGANAFPKDGRLQALRSQARLEQLRQTKAGLTARDLAEARKDADAAVALGATGEGNYALGRVLEEIGDRGAAERAYRNALAANPANDRNGSRYRVALGRVLLKLNPLPGQPVLPAPIPEPARERPEGNKVGQLLPKSDLDQQAMLVMLLTGFLAAEDEDDPSLDEIIRLADLAIRAKNYEGYLIKAGALARKGMWTEALRMYSEGLRYLIRPEYADGLLGIVNNHPAFNLPDPLRQPDVLRSERHFGAGLRAYFAGNYSVAEKELLEAYRNNGQDARILYYLGLSRLPLGKRQSAVVNWQMGAILEQQSKPSPAAVNSSLERIQGSLRQSLNSYRP